MDRNILTKAFVSVIALAGLVVHLIWPEMKLDAVALGFLLLALLPWLASVIRSIEIPGVGKVELQQRVDPESSVIRKQMRTTVQLFNSRGFYTSDGLANLIRDYGLVQPGEEVCEKLQIFRTRNQRTWLLATLGKSFACWTIK